MFQSEAITIFVSTIVHFALMLLACLAVCALASWRGIRDPLLLGILGMIALASVGYLAFWLWFFSPPAGRFFSLAAPGIAAVCSIWIFTKLDHAARQSLTPLAIPTALVLTVGLLVLSTGFMFGGLDDPFRTAATRFSHPLPGDNDAPYRLAEDVRRGTPILHGTWHSSDRPPLQAAIVLWQAVYLQHPMRFQYTVISVILQSLWIFALWLFLMAFDLNARSVALALAISLFSGFVFLNSFYVWPKLLAASYVIAFSALLLSDRFTAPLQKTTFIPMLAGALAAFGALAHGGSMFAIIGIVLTMLALRRHVRARSLIIMVLTSFCLYLPWILYQKLYDPPGDRLLKWHLAGVSEPDPRPFPQVLIEAYKNLTFHQFFENKWENEKTVVDHQAEYWSNVFALMNQFRRKDSQSGALALQTASALRVISFFYFAPCTGLLVFGPVALLFGIGTRHRTRQWRLAAISWLYIAMTALVWCLLMFDPGSTKVHQGTYVAVLLAFTGSVLALWALSPWLALVVGTLQVELEFLLYIWLNRPPFPGQPLAGHSLRHGTAALAMGSLMAVLFLFWRLAQSQLTRRCARDSE